MKKSDIFEIAIKILGLYLFVLVIGSLRDILTYLAVFSAQKPGSFGDFNQTTFFLISACYFLALLSSAFLLTFKTKTVVKKISSSSDYEESAQLFADKKVIYQIALVLTGLLLIIWTFPDFAFRLVGYFQLLHSGAPVRQHDSDFLITSAIKVIVALFAIFKSNYLSSLLASNKKATQDGQAAT
jgi:hypothetical protein